MFKIDDISFDDEKVFETISNGLTFGIFQLESYLGQTWAKKVSPKNIEEISDLISLIRPGPLESNMAEVYVNVKRGLQEPTYISSDLKDILGPTFGTLVYQEQAMKIAEKIAGFSLEEADKLRKAIGKKLPDEMEKLKNKFIDGAVKQGHKKEIGEEIFSWIEKFADYSFNKSHGLAYSINSYQTGFLKTYYPREYFTSMLVYSNKALDPQKEVDDIINDAKLYGIKITPPLLTKGNLEFSLEKDEIVFGLKYIKGIGASSLKNIDKIYNAKSFNDFILKCLEHGINKTTVLGLINSGATRDLGSLRRTQAAQYELVLQLSKKELSIFINSLSDNPNEDIDRIVASVVMDGAMKNRKPKLDKYLTEYYEKETKKNKDSLLETLELERKLLGTELSGHIVDLYNTQNISHVCLETIFLPSDSFVSLVVRIDNVNETKTKRGKNPGQKMCFLSASDASYRLDNLVVFPNVYSSQAGRFKVGNIVSITGKKSSNGGIIVHTVTKI